MDMGICSYNPQGDSRMEKVAAEGFKAKPLRRNVAKRSGSGAPSKPRAGDKIAPPPLTRHQKMRPRAIASTKSPTAQRCAAQRGVR